MYEFKFNANYYTDRLGKVKFPQSKFIAELSFGLEILAIPSDKNTMFVSPLNIGNKYYNLHISKLYIGGIQPRNKFLPGFDTSNENYSEQKGAMFKETIHPSNAKIISPGYSIQYDDTIGSVLPDTLNQ
jgi:hypothetical protein